MSDLFSSLNIGKTGINASQANITTTAHNMANARTVGFSRQRAITQTTRPFCKPGFNSYAGPGQFGTGVQVVDVQRIRNQFLDYQVREQTTSLGRSNMMYQYLTNIENVINEPTDKGISNSLDKFYDSWQELANKAEDANYKTVVAENSKTLAEQLNQAYKQLTDLKSDIQSSIQDTVKAVNSLINQIDAVNKQIQQVTVAGQTPNDLMDTRDLLLDQLSEKFGIKVDKSGDYNGINISPSDGGYNLVQTTFSDQAKSMAFVDSVTDRGNGLYEVGYVGSDGKTKYMEVYMNEDQKDELMQNRVIWTDKNGYAIVDGSGTAEDGVRYDFDSLGLFTPSEGELSGLIDTQDDIDSAIDELNNLAKSLAYSVNLIHNNESDSSGINFFVNKNKEKGSDDEITAGNISVNLDILDDPSIILTKPGNAVDGEEEGEAENTIALAIAGLRNITFKISDITNSTTKEDFKNNLSDYYKDDESGIWKFKSVTGGSSVINKFKDIVSGIGVKTERAKNQVTNGASLLQGFENQRMAVSGVSLDEEMANLIKFQHVYTANAKIISTVDQLMGVIINDLKR